MRTLTKCFCFDLETGCLILGWIGFICGTISSGIMIFKLDYYSKEIEAVKKKYTFSLYNNYEERDMLISELEAARTVLMINFIAVLCITIVSGSLLYGVYKRKSPYVLSYIIACVIYMILRLLSDLLSLFGEAGKNQRVLIVIFLPIGIVFQGYLILAVYSLYLDIKCQENFAQHALSVHFAQGVPGGYSKSSSDYDYTNYAPPDSVRQDDINPGYPMNPSDQYDAHPNESHGQNNYSYPNIPYNASNTVVQYSTQAVPIKGNYV